jgi:hypothetical protein
MNNPDLQGLGTLGSHPIFDKGNYARRYYKNQSVYYNRDGSVTVIGKYTKNARFLNNKWLLSPEHTK